MQVPRAQEEVPPLQAYLPHAGAGVLAFVVGLLLDQFTPYASIFPDYVASYIIPLQVFLGLVMVVTLAIAAGRVGFMFIWNAALWMLGGLLAGWFAWIALLMLTGWVGL